MRTIIFCIIHILSLLQLVSCMQIESVGRNKCLDSQNSYVDCSTLSSPILSSEFRKKYIAEVNIATSYEGSLLTFHEDEKDIDSDRDYSCELVVNAGKSFKVLIQGQQLTLRDGESQILLNREEGFLEEELIGSWSMTEETPKAQIITELIMYHADHLKIRKTCNLR